MTREQLLGYDLDVASAEIQPDGQPANAPRQHIEARGRR